MLGYLILAILAGFIAVLAIHTIRSHPKPQPEVPNEETLKCGKPKPVIFVPEETFVCPNCKRELNKKYLYKQGMCVDCVANSQKHDKPEPAAPTPEGKFVCRNCKRELNKKYLYKRGLCVDCVTNPQKYGKSVLTSSAPGKMALPERIKFEEGLGISPEDRFVYMRESGEYRKRERIEGYLGNDNLKSYMMETVVEQYSRYRSEAEMLHPPMTFTSVTVDETIRLLNELYSSIKGQQLGIKSRVYLKTQTSYINCTKSQNAVE